MIMKKFKKIVINGKGKNGVELLNEILYWEYLGFVVVVKGGGYEKL